MGSTVCVAACVDGAELDKGGERACTSPATSAGSVSVAAIAAAVAVDAADAGSVTSAGAAVVSKLPEGVSLAASIHGSFRRCSFLSCNSTSCACTLATLGAKFSCTCVDGGGCDMVGRFPGSAQGLGVGAPAQSDERWARYRPPRRPGSRSPPPAD